MVTRQQALKSLPDVRGVHARCVPGAGLGWPMLMIEQQPFPSMEWAELPILPHETTRDWGRMAWRGRSGGD